MVRYENNCHDCEVCTGCGRKEKRPVLYCDECDKLITEDTAYEVNDSGCYCLGCVHGLIDTIFETEDTIMAIQFEQSHWIY